MDKEINKNRGLVKTYYEHKAFSPVLTPRATEKLEKAKMNQIAKERTLSQNDFIDNGILGSELSGTSPHPNPNPNF